MWFGILYIINATLGTLFLILIVESKRHPMPLLGRRSGEGEV